MSFTRAARYGFSALVALACATTIAAPAAAQDAPAAGPEVSVSAGFDVVNQYMFRGIRQNSDGIATWPWVDLGVAAFEGDGAVKSVGLNVGTWNATFSSPSGWYESDVYASVGVGFGGGVSLASTYTSYTSPNDSFTHVKELSFKVAHDDLFAPYALVAFELGAEPGRYQADGGLEAGRYLELGVAPGIGTDAVSLSVPVKVGLSLGNYYELDGVDNRFGFFSVGGLVTVPVGPYFDVHGGAEFQALGDTTKAFNGGEGTQVVGSFGVGVGF